MTVIANYEKTERPIFGIAVFRGYAVISGIMKFLSCTR